MRRRPAFAPGPQNPILKTRHFSRSRRALLVIEPQKMQQAMNNENPELGRLRVSKLASLGFQYGQTNHELTDQALTTKPLRQLKTEHVRRTIFATRLAVKFSHRRASHDFDFDDPFWRGGLSAKLRDKVGFTDHALKRALRLF